MRRTPLVRKTRWLTSVLVCGLLAGASLRAVSESPVGGTDLGPAPRAADGRFTNGIGDLDRGPFGVRFPFMFRRLGTYFRSGRDAPERVQNDGAYLRENARHSDPTVTWIGHATMLVQMEHLTFLTDPIWSERPSPISFLGPSRYVAPGMEIEDLPPIDFVVISHNHYDHLDLPTLRALAERNPETVFYVPLGNGDLLRKNDIARVRELDWGESAQQGGATIHCTPTQHWSKRGVGDDLEALWSSWAVVGSERRFYFAGDTGYFEGFAKIGEALGPFDLVAVPIGAYAPREMMRASHMNPEEAWQAALDLRARRAVGMHYGTFDLSDEPLSEPPARFLASARTTQAIQENASAAEADRPGNAGGTATPDGPGEVPEAWVIKVGETRTF